MNELRERVARDASAQGVLILGPRGPNRRWSETEDEARHLEIAYGPAPNWVLHVISPKEIEQLQRNPYFLSMDIEGLRVVVGGAKLNVSLRVELHGDSIRISEQELT